MKTVVSITKTWALAAGYLAVSSLGFFWVLLVLQYLRIDVLQEHPINFYQLMGLLITAFLLSLVPAKVIHPYWFAVSALVIMTILFICGTLS